MTLICSHLFAIVVCGRMMLNHSTNIKHVIPIFCINLLLIGLVGLYSYLIHRLRFKLQARLIKGLGLDEYCKKLEENNQQQIVQPKFTSIPLPDHSMNIGQNQNNNLELSLDIRNSISGGGPRDISVSGGDINIKDMKDNDVSSYRSGVLGAKYHE